MCGLTRGFMHGNIREMLGVCVHGMKANGFFVAAMLVLISESRGNTQDAPKIISTTKRLKTKEDDIAHFTCTTRDPSPLSISWKKGETKLTDESLGIASLTWTNGTITESHLFVAVCGDDMRGEYICVASSANGKAEQSFVIEDPSVKGLTSTELAAIGVGIGLSLFFVVVILFFVLRGKRRLEKKNGGRSLSTHMEGAANSGMAGDGSVDGLDDAL